MLILAYELIFREIKFCTILFSQGTDVDTTCAEYENGTALHIAAANLGVSAVRILLNFGADSNITDDLARKPLDCVPEMHAIGMEEKNGQKMLNGTSSRFLITGWFFRDVFFHFARPKILA